MARCHVFNFCFIKIPFMRREKFIIATPVKILSLLCFLSTIFPYLGFSFDGYVKDAHTYLPIPYAIVELDGLTVIADADGRFNAEETQARCSAFGYESVEVRLEEHDSLVVYLQPRKRVSKWSDDRDARELAMSIGAKRATVEPYEAVAHSRVVGYKRVKRPKGREKYLEVVSDTLRDWYYVYSSEVINRSEVGANGPLQEEITDFRQDGYRWHGQYAQLVRQFSFNLWDNPIESNKVPFVNPFYPRQSKLYSYALLDTLRDAHGRTLLRVGFTPRKASRDKLLEGEFIIDAADLRLLYVAMRPSLGKSASTQFTVWQHFGDSPLGQWHPLEQAMHTNLGLGSLNTQLFSITEFTYPEPGGEQHDNAATLSSLRPLGEQTLPERTMRATQALAQEEDISAMAHKIDSYFSFRYPLRYVNIPLLSLVDLSSIEGIRVGLALETSDRLSSIVQLEGYYAYGICDNRHKYGGFFRANFLPRYAMQLQLGYTHDVEMPANLIWEGKGNRYTLDDYLAYSSAPVLDYRDDYRVMLRGRVYRGVQLFVEGAYTAYENKPGMGFLTAEPDGSFTPSSDPYALISGKIELRWVPLQRLAFYSGGAQVVEEKSPLIRLAYTVASDAKQLKRTFHKIESIVSSTGISPFYGSYVLSLRGGVTLGDYPLAGGYFNSGGGGSIFEINFKNVFCTVPIGFAYRDYFVELQTRYDMYPWASLKLLNSWELSPIVLFNAGWGGVWKTYNWGENKAPVDMSKGLFEVGLGMAGLIPNSILPPLRPSLSCYYRLGAYADSDPVKNMSIMLSFLMEL